MKPVNLNVYELNERSKKKKLACFGGGGKFVTSL